MAITAIHPYLHFDGQCEEAFRHYEQALGARCTGIHRYRDMPADVAGESNPECPPPSPESLDRVMNVELRVGALELMGSDVPPGMPAPQGGCSVSLQVDDPADAERIFAALMEGASTVTMPIGETFWATRFGMGTDRFGTPWMVNCSRDAHA